MIIKELYKEDIFRLKECLKALAAYHNEVSTYHKGFYPSNEYEVVLNNFCDDINSGNSHIAILEKGNTIFGFCKIDIFENKGKLDYLFISKESRGKGYGGQLLEWAMGFFHTHNINLIEVKVISGNEAIHLYEKYGFKMNAHILWHTREEVAIKY